MQKVCFFTALIFFSVIFTTEMSSAKERAEKSYKCKDHMGSIFIDKIAGILTFRDKNNDPLTKLTETCKASLAKQDKEATTEGQELNSKRIMDKIQKKSLKIASKGKKLVVWLGKKLKKKKKTPPNNIKIQIAEATLKAPGVTTPPTFDNHIPHQLTLFENTAWEPATLSRNNGANTGKPAR